MGEKILISKESIYKSNLNNGLIVLMALLCIDSRVPMFLEKDVLMNIVLKQLKQLEKANFYDIALICEQEVSKLLPTCDLKELRKLIVESYILYYDKSGTKNEQFVYVSNKRALDYLDEQLYVNILNCVYDLIIKTYKSYSYNIFSKKIKIGKKTCNILYPEFESNEAIKLLKLDIQKWINYNFLNTMCLVEEIEEEIYIKVSI